MKKDKSTTSAVSTKKISAKKWSELTVDTLFESLNSTSEGLSEDDAHTRFLNDGPNEVNKEKKQHPILQLIKSFGNPFNYVLITLSAVSFYTDYWIPLQNNEETDIVSAVIVLSMVAISGIMNFWQEYRSEKDAKALSAMVKTTVTAMRKDDRDIPKIVEIPMREVVSGDIILVSAGDMVPADVRIIESKDLFVSQAALTGESVPVEKYSTDSISHKNITHNKQEESESELDISSICFMGTNVVSGTAKTIVIAKGSDTYFGSLAKATVGPRIQTSFDKGVNNVSWLLIRFMTYMVPLIFFLNIITKGNWGEAFMFALAVAVGLTPEMLPMIVSANLAKGAMALSRHKVVVKHLSSIQNLGAMDILCTDKTGTLTQDRIILEHHLDVNGESCDSVLSLAWLNSFHQSGLKNLIDKAIIRFSEEHEQLQLSKNYKKVDEIPFDFIRRRLSVVVSKETGDHLLVCKGAVEEMLSVTSTIKERGICRPLDEATRASLLKLSEKYNNEGFRVLILCTKDINDKEKKDQYSPDIEKDLIMEGFLTFLDPPKETAAPALSALRESGVTVKVLTGDTAIITTKVCREVGLNPGIPLMGKEIEHMDDVQLHKAVEEHCIFAKLAPLQKSRIIKALQNSGHTVGFLGDGINDAPALHAADVGISVESGTDIAKESADIILLEKSLMVLEAGVIKGRETFGNIIKYINMTASSNFGNVLSVLVASAFLPFLPMLSLHLLIQNLMYDISQLALPWDKLDKEYLSKPRSWNAKNIGRFMIWIGPTSSIFDITTYALMWFIFGANSPEHQTLFQSGWFIEGLLSQTLVVHMLRTGKIPFLQSTASFPVLLVTILIAALGIYLPFSSIGAIVGLQPLPLEYFPWLVATLVCYSLVAQGMKMLYIRKFGQWF